MFVNRVGFLRGLILGRDAMQCIRSFTWLPTSGSFLVCHSLLAFDNKSLKLEGNFKTLLSCLAWFDAYKLVTKC